jgi:hypothetical protein
MVSIFPCLISTLAESKPAGADFSRDWAVAEMQKAIKRVRESVTDFMIIL